MTFQVLSIEDIEIRNAYLSYYPPSDSFTELINSAYVRDHDRWSEFLANRSFILQDGDSIESCCAALKYTFRCGT